MKNISKITFAYLLFTIVNCSGTRPDFLGVKEARLYPCPKADNCVGSFEKKEDKEHFVDPILYGIDKTKAYEELLALLKGKPNVQVVDQKPDYIYAEFTSKLMRYVDDVEFYFPASKQVEVRSASRIGSNDWGVNRKRIESIRSELGWKK